MMEKDFEDLTAAWLGHVELPAERQSALLARLRSDALFRAEFAEDAQMRAMTRAIQSAEPRWLELNELIARPDIEADAEFEERVAEEWIRIDTDRKRLNWTRWLGFGFAAVAIWLGSVMVAFQFGMGSRPTFSATLKTPPVNLPEDAVRAPVAILTRIVNGAGPVEAGRQSGSPLRPGRFHLDSGLAQLDFVDGARLLLRGPASLELASAVEARLLQGAATCSLDSPGRGFRLSTPGWAVVDTSGTFGLEVVGSNAELHTLSGVLTVENQAGQRRELAEASAVKLAGEAFEPVLYRPAFFPSNGEIDRLEREAVANRSVDWWEHAQSWSREPETLLHYTFMSDVYRDRRVENHAVAAAGDSHGIVIGAKWTEGRWPWKKALEFRKRTDRVLLGLPGNHARLTLATWLRVDGFTQPQYVLLSTKQPEQREADDSFPTYPSSRRRGEIRWMIDRSGSVQFKVATGSSESGQDWDTAATPRLFKDDAIGQWALLAVTYDADSGAVTHFWNGKPVSKSVMSNAAPLEFQYLELGNPALSESEHRGGDRYGFFGSLDELLISGRILEDREVAELFINGKPAS